MTTFDGKNVLITGSASGIGRLMAQKIAAHGANVILWDMNLSGLESLSDQLQRWGYRTAVYQQCDLSDSQEIKETSTRCGSRPAQRTPRSASWPNKGRSIF